MTLFDILSCAAADLQIHRFPEAFHVTCHTHDTHIQLSHIPSHGNYSYLIHLAHTKQTVRQSAARVSGQCLWVFVDTCQIQLYYEQTEPSMNASALHKTLISVIYRVQRGLTDH